MPPAAGCRRIFADKKSGKDTDRPELTAAMKFLEPGDTLVVPALDRFGRSLADLITMVGELRRRGVGFTSLHEALDTTTPGGRLVFHVFGVIQSNRVSLSPGVSQLSLRQSSHLTARS